MGHVSKNILRVKAARAACELHMSEKGEGLHEVSREDIIDLITDCLHLSDTIPCDPTGPRAILDMCQRHYEAETGNAI